MASKSSVEIKIIAQDDASAPIENVIEKTKELGAENRKVTKQSKKDWGALGDLFGKVLPRDMQGLIRGFKGTQRQVGRLSRSFKVLKAAWASVGIGLILIAMEELASYWGDVQEALAKANTTQVAYAKESKKATDAGIEQQASLEAYQNTLENVNKGDAERLYALKQLAKTLPEVSDLDIEDPENLKIVNQRVDELIKKAKILSIQEDFTNQLIDARKERKAEVIKLDENELFIASQMVSTKGKEASEAYKAERIAAKKQKSQEEFNKVENQSLKIQSEAITALEKIEANRLVLAGQQSERQKKLAEDKKEAAQKETQTERDAEAAYNKRVQKEKANAEWLAGERVRIAEDASLRIIEDDEKRELAALKIQEDKAAKELRLAGGLKEDLLALEDEYQAERDEITDRYAQEREAKEQQDFEKAESDRQTLLAALQTDQENEIDSAITQSERLFELAEGDEETEAQITEQRDARIAAINAKYEKKKQDDDQKTIDLKLAGANKMVNSMSGLLGSLMDLSEEGSEQQKRLAVTDVLLNQAMAMANAVAGAAKASKEGGPAAPFLFAAYVISMVGTVVGTFASIKKIMSEANAPSGGIGGGRPSMGGSSAASLPSGAQVPLPARLDSPDAMQAYVVQSQLDGQLQSQAQLQGQVVL